MPKLLICDDEASLRRLYQLEFESEGFEVVTASDGSEALEVLKHEPVDLVVLDIRMPGMDGLETLGHMLGVNKQLPVVLNTAYSSYKDNFMSWSADAYVVKSSNVGELLTKVREVLEKRGVLALG